MADEKPGGDGKFGRFLVKRLLGEGGMGRVWEAFDPNLEITVAVKELKEQYHDTKNKERFFREAQIAAKCHHHNIVLIKELCKEPPYFVMEFLSAEELTTYSKSTTKSGKPIALDRLVRILGQVCDGLAFLHSKGVAHRDLKPGNIMVLPDDTVKLTDFGISKAPFGQQTQTQVVMGTVPYMSPEQLIRPLEVDSRTDLWALGVILFEITQRARPFPGDGGTDTILAIAHDKPAEPVDLPPKVDEPLRAIIGKALTKEVGERFQTALEVKRELQGLLDLVDDPSAIIFPHPKESERPADPSILLDVRADCEGLVAEISRLLESGRELLQGSLVERASEQITVVQTELQGGNIAPLLVAMEDLSRLKAAIERGLIDGLNRFLSDAEELMLSGEYLDAARMFGLVLKASPDRTEAQRGIERGVEAAVEQGRLLAEADDIEGAIKLWKDVVQIQPAHEEAARLIAFGSRELRIRELLAGAGEHLQEGRPKEALALVEQALGLDKEHDQALELREKIGRAIERDEIRAQAEEAFGAGNLEAAHSLYQRLLPDGEAAEKLKKIDRLLGEEGKRKRIAGLRESARKAFEAGDYPGSEEHYRALLEMVSGDAEALESLAEIEKIREDLATEAAETAARPHREKLREEIDALAAGLERGRDILDEAETNEGAEIQDRCRRTIESLDVATLQGALEEIRAFRAHVNDVLGEAARSALANLQPVLSVIEGVPPEDRPLIDADLVTRSQKLASQARASATEGDPRAVFERAGELERLAGELQKRRAKALEALRSDLNVLVKDTRRVFEAEKASLKDAAGTARKIEAAARDAAKVAGGESLHAIKTTAVALDRLRKAMQSEAAEALKLVRAAIAREWPPVAERARRNPRSLKRDAALEKTFNSLKGRVDTAASERSLAALERLYEEIGGISIPFDRVRLAPYAAVAVVIALVAGGWGIHRVMYLRTPQVLSVELVPFGRISEIHASDGRAIAVADEGEKPLYLLPLVPGTYTLKAERSGLSEPKEVSVTIPANPPRLKIPLGKFDYLPGLRDLEKMDPQLKPQP